MSETIQRTPEPRAAAAGEPSLPGAQIRIAERKDAEAVAAAVRELLVELGATAPQEGALVGAARTLLETPAAGAVVVAEAGGALVGVLAASWQLALHVPGSYALIQDLWVHPAWRSRMIGRELIAALAELARAKDMARIEVGLPRERFPGFASTEAFYLGNGFEHLGPRMRMALS